ncbi:IS110 family transposase [Myroides odoratimimus]|uniref:IS110 family transposase n=1 Tax=Myroides odoratimimus TaxID=76832 RepID=UPI00103BA368|nr:IS110 family transposase [Myroides odoratimimus]MCO7724949.1 IS110 family transposase [Myroides odoratimimus]MDM1514508.1 IS110 family transposase [Myroides odoratimimus]QBK77498.1 IS110 family transposase [Myroides odoratimimus]WHT72941.1 IS110 family transposase [Myroides odoratimimus]WHU37525.1 IS110 family transposase [Myroides odoratimimus]
MDKFTQFIGIDISKDYFDVAIYVDANSCKHNQFENTKTGVDQFMKWMKSEGCCVEETLICMEHTGIYKNILVDILLSKNCNLWVEMAYRIIRSSGIQRGKNDKIDSKRIALYAKKNQEEAKLFKASKAVLNKIQALLGQREMSIAHKTAIEVRTNEFKGFNDELYKVLSKNDKAILKALENAIKVIEEQLNTLIRENQEVSEIFDCVISVRGVGDITAMFLICYTNAFTSFEDSRQLASYCGVVPFEYTSGKSVRGKAKVHFMANKKLKKLLHLCALSAVRWDPEIRAYYERKVGEGKHKMLVLNNVRNKLVQRICSCVRNKKAYEVRQVA